MSMIHRGLVVPPPSTYDEDSKGDTNISNTTEAVSNDDGVKQIILPDVVTMNPRPYLNPYELLSDPPDLDFLLKNKKEKHEAKPVAMMWVSDGEPPPPVPRFPMILSWHPNVLCVEIDKKLVVKKIQIMNRSKRIIYINYFGLWGEVAAAGAGWWCSPKTRMFVAPGLCGDLTVHARPHDTSPVPEARIGLQLAVNIKLDTVVGYFVIPVYVKYNNYMVQHFDEVPLSDQIGQLDQ